MTSLLLALPFKIVRVIVGVGDGDGDGDGDGHNDNDDGGGDDDDGYGYNKTNLFSRFDVTVDVLEHQWQTFSVLDIKVFNGDLPLMRPVIWRTIVWVDPLGLDGKKKD